MGLSISDSVGRGGRNKPADVLAVQARLLELGYDFFVPDTGTVATGLILAIRLFQSIIAGSNTLKGDGRVDPEGKTLRFFNALNAPRWQLMPEYGEGFANYERMDAEDHHDYGTNWMAHTIAEAGRHYSETYYATHPTCALLAINDVSLPHGGDTPDHQGHETGLACDILLPRKNGKAGQITWRSQAYDQETARAMLSSLRRQPLVAAVLFNDPELIAEELCSQHPGHDNHAHFSIAPPAPELEE